MSIINPRHIDSHWLLFLGKGAIALIFGWLMLFGVGMDMLTSIALCGVFLLCFSIIEFINSLYRAHMRFGWAITVLLALLDTVAAFVLILNNTDVTTIAILTLAVYTIGRGIAEILIGIRIDDDSTDRFIWIITGICGAVMGLVILNCGQLTDTSTFIRFFGSYIFVSGITNLIYGIHNRDQKLTSLAEKAEKRSARKSAKKPAKKSAKPAKKSTKKSR